MSFWGNETDIGFPNLGFTLKHVPRGISIFNFDIAFYGIIIALGMIGGILIARWQAKRSGQDPEKYLDFALWAIPLSVIGARLYSVAFEWDYYKNDLLQIFNLRNGGLAIYGGVITAVLFCLLYCKLTKMNAGLMADTGILGMLVGQLVGRWGNFTNRECFGKYTDSLFAMRINVNDSGLSSYFKPSVVSDARLAQIYDGKPEALKNILEIRNHIITGADGLDYIQVQPTFLYESLWNLTLLIILIIYWPKKKFNGEILLWYLFGYGLGRFWIEGLRTDQLFLWNSPLAVSQVFSAILAVGAAILIIILSIRAHKRKLALGAADLDKATDTGLTQPVGEKTGEVVPAKSLEELGQVASLAELDHGSKGQPVKPSYTEEDADNFVLSAELTKQEEFDIGKIEFKEEDEEKDN